jgi:hypothetical protein
LACAGCNGDVFFIVFSGGAPKKCPVYALKVHKNRENAAGIVPNICPCTRYPQGSYQQARQPCSILLLAGGLHFAGVCDMM